MTHPILTVPPVCPMQPMSPVNRPASASYGERGDSSPGSAGPSEGDSADEPLKILHACLSPLPILAAQLEEASKQIEESVVAVCTSFQAISQRAQDAVAGNPMLQAGGKAADSGFESLISETRSTLSKFLERIEQSNQFSSLTAERMQSLDEQIHSVRETLHNIDDVAANARLLALNGQIEAARAGSRGATFAVVAKGTAEMAQHASTSSKMIRDLIEIVATNTSDASTKLQDRVLTDKRESLVSRAEVNRMLDAMASLHDDMQRTISSSQANCESLARDISKAVVLLQFQDAVGQRIAHVIHSLREMYSLYRRHAGGGEALRHEHAQPSASTSDWKKDISRHYTMEEERRVHAASTDHGVLPNENGGSNVELF
jgi:methyl-accepting chemotaxis protein